MSSLTSKDIIAIIKAAREADVSEISFGGLSVKLRPSDPYKLDNDLTIVEQNINNSPRIVLPDAPLKGDIGTEDERLSLLMLEDSVAYEEAMMGKATQE